MFELNKVPPLTLGLTGLEFGLSEEELAIQEVAHRFAKEVMRPIAAKLDTMTPEEVAAPGSPIFEFIEKLTESGLFDLETMASMSLEQQARIIPIINEELGWGDPGLGVIANSSLGATVFAYRTGNPELIERFAGRISCGMVTQPDRGSDFFDLQGSMLHPGSKQHRGNLTAKIDGDEVVLNGQCSAWVSGAGIAQTATAHVPCDYGDGIIKDNGAARTAAILVDLEVEGVSKGVPLDALGQRSLSQCEVFFTDVRYPRSHIIADESNIEGDLFGIMLWANMQMGNMFTGVARAAYEHALQYCHERIQGGVPIIEHQSVKMRLYSMWEKLQAARSLSRQVTQYNYASGHPHLVASITSKTFVTRTCFEIASEAVQLFGAAGLSKEYPIEKVFRDARASMIEDGENNLIGLKAMTYISQHYKDNN